MTIALVFRGNSHATTGWSFKRALEAEGVDFEHIDNNEILSGARNITGHDAAIVINDMFALQPMRLPANSAYFLIDGHNGLNHYLPALPQYRYIYSANWTNGVQLLNVNGFQNVQWTPLAWDDIDQPYEEVERTIPVSCFLHGTTDQRFWVKEVIKYKYGGDTEYRFHKDLADGLNCSKVSVNVQGGSGHNVKYDHINQRVFEVMGSGALLLQQELKNPITGVSIPDLKLLGLNSVDAWWMNTGGWDRHGDPNTAHLVAWRDASSIFETIERYTSPAFEAERAAIAKRGHDWVAANHTYRHRVRKILEDLRK